MLPNGGFPPIKYKNEQNKKIDKQRGFINEKKEINIKKLFEEKKVIPLIDFKKDNNDDLEVASEI